MQTPRLVLRQIAYGDAPSIHAYRSVPEVARLQAWSTFELSDAESLVAGQASLKIDTPGSWFQLAIVDRSTSQIVGDCGLHFSADAMRQVELGITLDPHYQGRGLAAEALHSVVTRVFGHLNKQSVIAIVDAKNRPAQLLFERLRFRQKSIDRVWFKGCWEQERTFAVEAHEWQ